MKAIVFGLATLALLTGCAQQSCDDHNRATISKYERWVQELRAKDALSRSLLEERTDHFARKVAEMERRSEAYEETIKKAAEDINYQAQPLNDEFFEMIDIGLLELSGGESARDIARSLQILAGVEGARALTEQLSIDHRRSSVRISYTIEGLSDPRMLARQYVVETDIPSENGAEVLRFGVRNRCRIDRMTTNWGKEACA